MKNIVLGIDTSNYTTSLAIMDCEGELLANIKKPLYVSEGQRGLRQSEAVFSHIKNIPYVMDEARKFLKDNKICAVGVSTRPRNTEGSYMPCFLSGVSLAEGISAALSVPLYCFSHQCGHIMAAVYSSGNFDLLNDSFAALHISGGTTELLHVNKYTPDGFDAELVGGTKDLNAGQIIDRIGVYMGLKFPSGPEMETLALANNQPIPSKRVSASGTQINLSGLENIAQKVYCATGDKSLTSALVFDYLSRSIASMCHEYEEIYGKSTFVFAGGVMSNSIIKTRLASDFNSYFAIPAMSSDNAVGIAYLALRALKK